MAKTITLAPDKTITIKNILAAEGDIITDVPSGKRVVMTLKEAIDGKYKDFQYLLSPNGNFIVEGADGAKLEVTGKDGDGTTATIDKEAILVIVRQCIKNTDRYVQFYRTQQQILLHAGDELVITVKTPAEAAYYMSLAVEGEITVDDSEFVTDAAAE